MAFVRLIDSQLRRFVVLFVRYMMLLHTPLHGPIRPLDLGSLLGALLAKHRQQDDPSAAVAVRECAKGQFASGSQTEDLVLTGQLDSG